MYAHNTLFARGKTLYIFACINFQNLFGTLLVSSKRRARFAIFFNSETLHWSIDLLFRYTYLYNFILFYFYFYYFFIFFFLSFFVLMLYNYVYIYIYLLYLYVNWSNRKKLSLFLIQSHIKYYRLRLK